MKTIFVIETLKLKERLRKIKNLILKADEALEIGTKIEERVKLKLKNCLEIKKWLKRNKLTNTTHNSM